MHKRANLHKLIARSYVLKDIPFRVYFMACNLEHVLHGIPNASKEEKEALAESFAEKYEDDLEGFLAFIRDESFALSMGYRESWDFVKRGVSSLGRFTNLNLFFSENSTDISEV